MLVYFKLFSSTLILSKHLHPSNAEPPILVTPSGIFILVKLLHPQNASIPILVTPSGIFILVKLLHPLNVHNSILVTPFGIFMFVKLLHPPNASPAILVTPFGIFILAKLLHPENAPYSILIKPFSILTFSIIFLYLLLCQSSLELDDQLFISPLPEIVIVLSSNVHLAITLPSPFLEISHVSSSFISYSVPISSVCSPVVEFPVEPVPPDSVPSAAYEIIGEFNVISIINKIIIAVSFFSSFITFPLSCF